MSAPTVLNIRKGAGIAGQYEVTAQVQYDDEAPESITFVGSVYGGPVVMVTPTGAQTFVTEPERHGTFGTEWVRRFFA